MEAATKIKNLIRLEFTGMFISIGAIFLLFIWPEYAEIALIMYLTGQLMWTMTTVVHALTLFNSDKTQKVFCQDLLKAIILKAGIINTIIAALFFASIDVNYAVVVIIVGSVVIMAGALGNWKIKMA